MASQLTPTQYEDLALSQEQGQFSPHSSDAEGDNVYPVECVVAQKGHRYKVRWVGVDPETGEPWPDSWVTRSDITDDVVQEWKIKQKVKKLRLGKNKGMFYFY